MADRVYQLSYDTELDKDIHSWLEKLPRSRKAELVRNAIRFYLQATGETPNPIITLPSQLVKKQTKEKKKPSLPKDGNL